MGDVERVRPEQMLRERRHARQRRERREIPPVARERQMLRIPREDRRVQQRIAEVAVEMGGEDRQEMAEEQRRYDDVDNGCWQHFMLGSRIRGQGCRSS